MLGPLEVEIGRAIAGEHERTRGPGIELGHGRIARRPRQRDRLGQVMGDEVGVVREAIARHLLDPIRCRAVLCRPPGTGDLPVRHIPDERVPERVLRLSLHR